MLLLLFFQLLLKLKSPFEILFCSNKKKCLWNLPIQIYIPYEIVIYRPCYITMFFILWWDTTFFHTCACPVSVEEGGGESCMSYLLWMNIVWWILHDSASPTTCRSTNNPQHRQFVGFERVFVPLLFIRIENKKREGLRWRLWCSET